MKSIKSAGLMLTLLCLSVCRLQAQDKSAPLPLGSPAPPLAIGTWIKGDRIDQLQKGKIYVIEFWATWCQPCIAGMPHLSEVARKFQKDVTVISFSILERKTTTIADIQKFVTGMGSKMDYRVAAEADRAMSDSWLHAFGERGIPCAFVVDREGTVAWLGLPKNLDDILPQVISGKWDVNAEAAKKKERQRLLEIDGNEVVNTMNKYMGRPGNPQGALARIDSFLRIEPALKYYPMLGHFTYVALAKTDQHKAVAYGKIWLAANPDAPRYSTVTDAAYYIENASPEFYLFTIAAYQAQLDLYPWSMDFKATYQKMAELYKKAGEDKKAAEMEQKTATAPAKTAEH